MDQMTIENCSIISTEESLPEFERNDLQAGFLPSINLPEIYRGKSGKTFYPEYTQEARVLHWALDRLAGWELPGKEHVEEYFRSMYRRNFRPKTYSSALTAIYVFLIGVRDSGKTRLEEITKNDIEAFIEHEQDRGMMLSTVRTRLHCVNAFLGYAIDAGVVSTAVLALVWLALPVSGESLRSNETHNRFICKKAGPEIVLPFCCLCISSRNHWHSLIT